jgi:hypothetical protein
VVAPPDLGKSWFLDRLGAEMGEPKQPSSTAESPRWVARLVDVREQPLAARSDATLLLASLFGLTPAPSVGPDAPRDIARRILQAGRPHLCLLDSAELLERETVKTLRSYFSEIHRRLQEAGNIDVRLAFVVASRREAEWGGVAPAPRVVPLPLTEFGHEVVRETLRDLAMEIGRNLAHADLKRDADRVRRLSEGLPAVLVACLQWIQREQWQDMDRLESQEVFEELVRPYVERDLLSVDSLLPWGGRNIDEERAALQEAFRVLAPYRLFTSAHLRHHLQSDSAFEEALRRRGWTIDDLWKAIGETALLERPLHEPWQAIHRPIRRLLYRYYYRSSEHRHDAHREARQFVATWTEKQVGTEQVVGLVECLWHEAAMLLLDRAAEPAEQLGESARNLSRTLEASPAYTVSELRASAAERLRNDEELEEALGHTGLLERLADIIAPPP